MRHRGMVYGSSGNEDDDTVYHVQVDGWKKVFSGDCTELHYKYAEEKAGAKMDI
jgi:hypothetical protein